MRRVREPIGEVDWEDAIEGSGLVEEPIEMFEIWDARVVGVVGESVEVEDLVVEDWDVVDVMDGRLSFRGGPEV